MENVVLCHPDKEETELDDIPGNRTAPTTEKEDSDGMSCCWQWWLHKIWLKVMDTDCC